jgi:hypothetical protein
MDGMILYFGKATHEQVEQAAQPFGLIGDSIVRGQSHFYFSRYSQVEQAAENDESEVAKLHSLLGSAPMAAFHVASAHGQSARFALEVVSHLMQQFSPAILDDDFNNLLSAEEVRTCLEFNASNDIYSLRAG